LDSIPVDAAGEPGPVVPGGDGQPAVDGHRPVGPEGGSPGRAAGVGACRSPGGAGGSRP
jgi:hypothetical protein